MIFGCVQCGGVIEMALASGLASAIACVSYLLDYLKRRKRCA